MTTTEKLNEMVFTANWEESQTEIHFLGGNERGWPKKLQWWNCSLAKGNVWSHALKSLGTWSLVGGKCYAKV